MRSGRSVCFAAALLGAFFLAGCARGDAPAQGGTTGTEPPPASDRPEEVGPGVVPGPGPETRVTPESPGQDSLVVLIRTDSVSAAQAPRDWVDLLHLRFREQVSFPDPAASPEARAFMERVLRAEAARTGVDDAGFDWLRRLDAVVFSYPGSRAEAEGDFRLGSVVVLVTTSEHAREILAEEGSRRIPASAAHMQSGAFPFPEGSGSLPPGWLTEWRLEVRGRG